MAKEYGINLGGRGTITIHRKGKKPAVGQPARHDGIIPVEEDDVITGRRVKKGLTTIYDLGTRLNQSGGSTRYEEILFDALAGADDYTYTPSVNNSVASADQLALDAAALAGTPLGTALAVGSGRKLSNCAQLMHATDAIAVDLYYATVLRIVAASRKSVQDFELNGGSVLTNNDWILRTALPADASETWQMLMVNNGEAFATGTMKHKGIASGALRVRSRLFYENFDTGDTTNFKITVTASYTAPTVAFTLNKNKKYDLFLKPQWLVFRPRKNWTWTRAITFNAPVPGAAGTANLTTSASLVLGPYASRMPIIPNPVNGVWSSHEVSFLPSPGAILSFRMLLANLTRHPSSAIHYRMEYIEDVAFNSGSTHCSSTPAISGDIAQSTALAGLQAAALAASDAVMACMTAAGYTSVAAASSGVGTLHDIDNLAIFAPVSVPAGLLWGIIRQGSNTFYVWRKTSETRSADFTRRDNGVAVFFD